MLWRVTPSERLFCIPVDLDELENDGNVAREKTPKPLDNDLKQMLKEFEEVKKDGTTSRQDQQGYSELHLK